VTKGRGDLWGAASSGMVHYMARSTTPRPAPDAGFANTWNATDKVRRKQIRRLVRVGRPQETAADARLAVGFVGFQRSRLWYRFFWLWFPVVVLGALYAATLVHPLAIGVVLAVAANGFLVRWNFGRTEKVNAEFLAEAGSTPEKKKERLAPSGITLRPRAKKRAGGRASPTATSTL